jgi:O-antigen/teichoic acid export membrane protein
MHNRGAIFISTVSQILVRIIGIATAFISVKLIATHLGTEGSGNFNTIATYFNFCIILADLGLFSTAVREIAKNPTSETKIITNIFWVRLATAFVATLVAIIGIFLTPEPEIIRLGVLVGSGFIFFNLMGSVYDMVLQYHLKMQYSAIAELASKTVTLAALAIILFYHGSFYSVVFTSTIAALVMFIGKYLGARHLLKMDNRQTDLAFARHLLTLSIPLGAVFIVNNIFFKLDTLMLYTFKGAAAVGIYSVAYKVLEVTLFIGSYFASSLKPTLTHQLQHEPVSAAQLIRQSITIMLIVSAPITIISAVFSKGIILFLSSPAFITGSWALVVLSLTLPFLYLDILLGEILIATDKKRLLIGIAVFMLAFNFIANLYIIPRYSFYGAAVSTLLSEILLFLINLYYTRQILAFSIDWSSCLKIALVAVLTFFGCLQIRMVPVHVLFQIIACFILYTLLIFLLRIIRPEQIKQLVR